MDENKENEVNNVESEVNQSTNTTATNDKKGFSIAALWYYCVNTWNYRLKIKQKRNVNCRNYYRCYWYDTKYCISSINCIVRCKHI